MTNILKTRINEIKASYAGINTIFALSFYICQGPNLYTFDRVTTMVNAFTVDRFINPNEPFHLVVNMASTTDEGTVDKSIDQAFDWSGIQRIWNDIYSDMDII